MPETIVPTLNHVDELNTFNVTNSQFGHSERSSMAFAKNGSRRDLHFCQVPDCEKTHKETLGLKGHLQWHSDEHPFVCILCNYKRFQGLDSLEKHCQKRHAEKVFKCYECEKRFKWKYDLKRHVQRHFQTLIHKDAQPT